LTNFDFSLLKKSFVDVVAFLNWQKLATRKKKLNSQYNHLILNTVFS
jgi:hypothetical protein